MRENFNQGWWKNSDFILENLELPFGNWSQWREIYYQVLNNLPAEDREDVGNILEESNPKTVLLRPVIEGVWESITKDDDWQPFQELVRKLQTKE